MSSNEALAGLGTVAAAQLKVSQYLNIASLAVRISCWITQIEKANQLVKAFVWDALLHADQDYDLVFGRRIGVPTVAYFLSRYVLLS